MKAEKTITQIFEESERIEEGKQESSPFKPIYRDRKEYGGETNYVHLDSIVFDILTEKHISPLGKVIFMYVLCRWDNPIISNYYTKPVELSLNVLAKRENVTKMTVRNCINELINAQFIVSVYKAKGGKKPSTYMPNVDYIHELQNEYCKRLKMI